MIISSQNPTRTTTAPARPERTPLQKHVDFFDRDGDHFTTVGETYEGLRALGLGRIASGAAALVINGALSRQTGAPWYSLTLHNDNIAGAKHDSNSKIYGPNGEFVPAKFEEMWAKNDTNGDKALDSAEIDAMIDRNKESTAGRLASKAEFGLLNFLAGQPGPDGGKVLTKERMQSFYDGNLFYQVAEEKAQA